MANNETISFFSPAVESLLGPPSARSAWPEKFWDCEELEKQVKQRRHLSFCLRTLFSKIPNTLTEVSSALGSYLIGATETEKLYRLLTDFLEADENNARIILYLPFELLPNKSWQIESPSLTQAIEEFSQVYLKKWESLLADSDNRANFVDGDIPELEVSPLLLPKVVKAAHLIPILVQKELVSAEYAISLMKETPDQILKHSLIDAIIVLADMNLLSAENVSQLAASKDRLANNVAVIINDKSKKIHTLFNDVKIDLEKYDIWLATIDTQLHLDMAALDKDFLIRLGQVSTARAKWKKTRNFERLIEKYSQIISLELKPDSLFYEGLLHFFFSHKSSLSKLVGINGIRIAVERLAAHNSDQAKMLQLEFEILFQKLWKDDLPEIQDALESTWLKWFSLGLINRGYLNRFGIDPTRLERPFSDGVIGTEINYELRKAIRLIEIDERLSRFIYPALIVYGSSIKGYATRETDIDIAIFIKPGTPITEKQNIRRFIAQIFKNDKIGGKALEFWLTVKDEKLSVIDFSEYDPFIGSSAMAHVLFEGAWCGRDNFVKELHEELLSNYFYPTDRIIKGQNATRIWFKELERDTLQYRLMHKGYTHFYPEQGGLKTEHSNAIDSESTFWDSGYRQLATRLFINKVFLPKLKNK